MFLRMQPLCHHLPGCYESSIPAMIAVSSSVNEAVPAPIYLFSIMNGGTGKKYTIKETLSLLSKKLHKKNMSIHFNKILRAGDPRFYHADMSEALQFNWSAQISLEDGIQKYVNWFIEEYK